MLKERVLSEAINTRRFLKHFRSRDKAQMYKVGPSADIHLPNCRRCITRRDLISSWKSLAENSRLLTIKHVRVHIKATSAHAHSNALTHTNTSGGTHTNTYTWRDKPQHRSKGPYPRQQHTKESQIIRNNEKPSIRIQQRLISFCFEQRFSAHYFL